MAHELTEDHPTIRALKKEIAGIQAEHDQKRDTTLRTRVRGELTKLGLDATGARHAMALLIDGEKRIKWSDDALTFRDADGATVDLSTGLAAWLKEDDGAHFLPAPAPPPPAADPPVAPKPPPTRAEIGAALLHDAGGAFRSASTPNEVARANLSKTILTLI